MGTITLPAELLDHILQYIDAIDRSDPHWKSDACCETDWCNAKQNFSRIRLVNRAYHDSATPYLFRYVDGVMRAPSHKKSSYIWSGRLSTLSSGGMAYHIRKLDIGFDEASWTPDALSDFVRASARVIPSLVSTCNRLQVLKIHGIPQLVFGHDLYRKEPPPHVLEMFTRIIVDIFTRLSLLGAASKLRQLDLSLPLTYNFSELHRTASEKSANGKEASIFEFMKHLRELNISIGHSNFQETYQKYPNWVFMDGFLAFIQAASNIHALRLRSNDRRAPDMDLNLLPTLHFPALTNVSLSGAQISEDNFMTFTAAHASTVTTIQLEKVALKAGTWESVFTRLRDEAPNLVWFKVGMASYDKYGASAHLHLGMTGFNDEFLGIHTLNTGDLPALERLQRYLGGVRAVRGLVG